MQPFTPHEADISRSIQYSEDSREMYLDVGFFMSWFSVCELVITAMLAATSDSRNPEMFDVLCRGMDARVKIERLRKAAALKAGIGPNLDKRLRYFEEKAIPLRNSLSHSAMTMNEDEGPRRYFLSTLSNLPWKELGLPMPFPSNEPRIVLSSELHGWGVWLAGFTNDLTAAFRSISPSRPIEIENPKTTVRQEAHQLSRRKDRPSKRGKRAQKPQA